MSEQSNNGQELQKADLPLRRRYRTNNQSIAPKKPSKLRSIFSWIGRLFVFPVAIVLLFCLIFFALKLIQKTGQLSLDLTNITKINNLKAAGIFACFTDDYIPFQESTIYLQADTWFYTDGGLQVMEGDQWIEVDELSLMPTKHSKIIFKDKPDRIDYEIITTSTFDENRNINYASTLSYTMNTKDDFTYIITSPRMEYRIYCPVDEKDYLTLEFQDCEVSYFLDGKEFPCRSDVRIPVDVYYDKNFGEEWMKCRFYVQNKDIKEAAGITFEIAPHSESPSGAATILSASYLKEIDLKCTGSFAWRYGKASDEVVHNDTLHFVVDEQEIHSRFNNAKKETLLEYGYENEEDEVGYASFVNREYHYSDTQFEISVEGKERITKLKKDSTVSAFSINGIDQFPNFGMYLLSNWQTALIASIVLAAFSYFMSVKKKN